MKDDSANAFMNGLRRLLERMAEELQHQGHQRTAPRPQHGTRSGRVRPLYAASFWEWNRKVAAVDHLEYLLSYGLAGDFGRFRAARPLSCRRGDRAVVRTHRGLEIGARAARGHAAPRRLSSQYHRRSTAASGRLGRRPNRRAMRERGRLLFDRGRATGRGTAIAAGTARRGSAARRRTRRSAPAALRRFRRAAVRQRLSREFRLHILLTDLSRPAAGGQRKRSTPAAGARAADRKAEAAVVPAADRAAAVPVIRTQKPSLASARRWNGAHRLAVISRRPEFAMSPAVADVVRPRRRSCRRRRLPPLRAPGPRPSQRLAGGASRRESSASRTFRLRQVEFAQHPRRTRPAHFGRRRR